MNIVTTADREKERRHLLRMMNAHPERDWTKQRARVAILNQMIKGDTSRTH